MTITELVWQLLYGGMCGRVREKKVERVKEGSGFTFVATALEKKDGRRVFWLRGKSVSHTQLSGAGAKIVV